MEYSFCEFEFVNPGDRYIFSPAPWEFLSPSIKNAAG